MDVETQLAQQWDDKINKYFNDIVHNAKTLLFTENFELSNHKFGSLAIESKNGKDINRILLAMNNVAHTDQYTEAGNV